MDEDMITIMIWGCFFFQSFFSLSIFISFRQLVNISYSHSKVYVGRGIG